MPPAPPSGYEPVAFITGGWTARGSLPPGGSTKKGVQIGSKLYRNRNGVR
jgi:hypothetical protein